MHILTIPSWYPLDEEDLNGIFFTNYVSMHRVSGHTSGLLAPQLIAYRSKEIKKIRSLVGYKISSEEFPSVRFIAPNIPRRLKIYYYRIVGLILFKKYIRKFGKPDLIHAHSMIWGGYIANILHRIYGVPYILTEHNSRFVGNGFIPKDEIKFAPRIIRESMYTIGVSDFMRNALIKLSPESVNKIISIPNPVEFSKSLKSENHRSGIFSVCNLNQNKRVDFIIKAYSKSRTSQNHNLFIIGEGRELDNLKSLAIELGIQDKVKFLGALDNRAVLDHLQAGHLFVSASKFETFGIAIIEALMAGMPVISTPSGGPEDNINPSNGIYLERDDVDCLARAIDEVDSNIMNYDRNRISDDAIKKYSYNSVSSRYNYICLEALKT